MPPRIVAVSFRELPVFGQRRRCFLSFSLPFIGAPGRSPLIRAKRGCTFFLLNFFPFFFFGPRVVREWSGLWSGLRSIGGPPELIFIVITNGYVGRTVVRQ